jgi:branched-chain amino acid aminotransferase
MRFWVNDRLVDSDEAQVSVLDHGFTVADGVFETLKIVAGVPFALTRHLERLHTSAAAMGLPTPDLREIRSAIDATMRANATQLLDGGRLRITYTGGVSSLGSDRADTTPTIVVAVGPAVQWPPSAAVITVEWPRNERSPLAGVKSTSYAENVIALARARALGASEAIVGDTQGRLCEGTGSNVFIVLDGILMTPSAQTGCLLGITRSLVLEWTDAIVADVALAGLERASEIFLTSSTRDVQPVHRCDGQHLVAPGPVTTSVMAEFARRADGDVDP